MEKHGYTPLHQAKLLREQLLNIRNEINVAYTKMHYVVNALENPVPDYGGIGTPSLSDITNTVNRASNTAACLQTLVMLSAIENKQL